MDNNEKVKRLRLAAEKGLMEAQHTLGNYYMKGEVVILDKREGLKWYKKAAEQGHIDSQYFLGDAFFYGDLLPKDKIEAVKWLRLAAEQGHLKSQMALFHCYYNGEGVSKDIPEAYKWCKLGAEQGCGKAQDIFNNINRPEVLLARIEFENYKKQLSYDFDDFDEWYCNNKYYKLLEEKEETDLMLMYRLFKGYESEWTKEPFDPALDYWTIFKDQHDNSFNNNKPSKAIIFRLSDYKIPEEFEDLFIDNLNLPYFNK